MKVFVACLAALAVACAQDFPVLHPGWAEDAPQWAKDRCGAHPNMCSDGGCCGQDFVCGGDDPDVLPMYRPYHAGHCHLMGRGL